jgi:integrase
MNIKRICQFLPDKEAGKPDAKLRYRIKWDSNKSIVAFNVGYRVDVAKWSAETQRCINNTTHGKKKVAANIINREIQRFEQIADEVFGFFESAGKVPGKEEFRVEFNVRLGRVSTEKEQTLFDVLDKFIDETGRLSQWTKPSYQKYAALKNHLSDFDKNVSFDNLDKDNLMNFVAFLRDEMEMRNTSIENQLLYLRRFLRWATDNRYNNNLEFQKFNPKLKISSKKVIFLDWDELMTVYKFNIPDKMPGIERVRDVFCFCCFTGLRYSDVANLRRSDVFDAYLSVTTIKTADSLKIELNNYSKAILNKYKDIHFENDRALPVISNQKMNDALKELGELCGIDKPVTITYYRGNKRIDEVMPKHTLLGTHAGRRTFVCNALMLGISPQIVMKWTGHSDYKSMKPYIDVADKAKENAMKLFNKRKSPTVKKQGLKTV